MLDQQFNREGTLIQDDESFALTRISGTDETGVSWSAIFAGAAGAAALSLIMLILGVGLGLSSVSPWAQAGVAAATFGVSTILWITFTQLVASGIGGYLAGRLRKKWSGVHTDEVYFRDTAHGFLAWAIATLATAALLAGVIGSILSGAAKAGATVAGGVASTTAVAATGAAASGGAAMAFNADQGASYAVDSLLRRDIAEAPTQPPGSTGAVAATAPTLLNPEKDGSSGPSSAEVSRIFANSFLSGVALPQDDVKYVGQMVVQRAGISQQDAEKRVTDAYSKVLGKAKEAAEKAKKAADQARKASAYAALWLFVSLLLGAFVASLMATFGGRQRDI